MKDLHELANEVNDEKDFLRFLGLLGADWHEAQEMEKVSPSSPYSAGARGWENGTIGDFLEAASDWGASSLEGLPLYQKPENPWRRAAHILLAGKFYE